MTPESQRPPFRPAAPAGGAARTGPWSAAPPPYPAAPPTRPARAAQAGPPAPYSRSEERRDSRSEERRDFQAEAPRDSRPGSRRTQDDVSVAGVIPLLVVLVVVAVGVYIAWREGSHGGGAGGVLAGAALLVAAAARLLLPARAVGLLASRKRATDVITLALLGVGVLVAGLVLPR